MSAQQVRRYDEVGPGRTPGEINMTDYQIQSSTRRCALTGEELRPGDSYYSVLLEEGGTWIRKDYSARAWQGPPEGAFSFWKGRLGEGKPARRAVIDDELLMDCFHRLEGEQENSKVAFRYVLGLLLIRRKRLHLEGTHREGEQEYLQLRGTRKGERYQLLDPGLSDEELEYVQEDVFRVLGWDG